MEQHTPGRAGAIRRRADFGLAGLILAVLATASPSLEGASAEHLAIGAPAAQSSTFDRAVAGRAVDGEANGEYIGGSVSLTHRDPYPYWWVDLGAPVEVGSVVIHGRTDAYPDRLDHFIVIGLPDGASPATDPLLTTLDRRKVAEGEFAQGSWTIYRSESSFSGADAREAVPLQGTFRYIYVMLPRADYLQLAEVEVWPPATEE